MASFRFIFTLVLVGISLRLAEAIQLGDTRQQIEARYDTAPIGDDQKRIAIYRWDLWKLQIQYTDDVSLQDVAKTLVYSKLDPMSDDEISQILDQNGGLAHWKVTGSAMGRAVAWTRSDGATAAFDATKGQVLTLHGGKMPGPTPIPSPAAAVALSKPVTPVVKIARPSTSPMPAKVPSALVPKTAATPPVNPVFAMAVEALHQKPVDLGIALIVVGVVLKLLLSAKQGSERKREPGPFAEGKKPNRLALYMVPTLENLTWQQFELLMGEVFRRKGYAVEISSGDGADGGVDLRLKKDGELVLAQCKQYLSGKVSVVAVREFYGVVKAENAARGIFINTSNYTQDAYNFAQGKEVELLDGAGVKALIASVTQPGENIYDIQRWLAEFTANAVITHPDCQFCKTPMVLRDGPRGRFWGCQTYPACKGTRDARLELVRDLVIPEK